MEGALKQGLPVRESPGSTPLEGKTHAQPCWRRRLLYHGLPVGEAVCRLSFLPEVLYPYVNDA